MSGLRNQILFVLQSSYEVKFAPGLQVSNFFVDSEQNPLVDRL